MDVVCIGAEGGVALASMPRLTDLDLGHNKVGDTGAIALAASNSLRWLYLERNGITAKGIAALRQNSNFIELYLADNDGIKPTSKRKVKFATSYSPSRGQIVKSCLND